MGDMDEMRKIKHLNLVIVPRIGRSFFNVVISHKLIYAFFALVLLIAGLNVYLLAGYFRVKQEMREKAGSGRVNINVTELREETETLKDELKTLKEASERIEQKTGISPEPGYMDYKRREVAMPSRGYNLEVENLQRQLRQLRLEVLARKNTMEQAENEVDDLVSRYDHLPSIRPVRDGRITSVYGYRIHPITRMREFHRGLDLKGTRNTPIFATADGVVEFSGWRHGYGRTVIIDHENGFQTLFAHTYRNLVKKGEAVKKRQIIGYVGSSGTTTGTHVHYEVQYKGRLMNPQKFMSLTLSDAVNY
ncbi:peptidoglycan DD-metalloendopeptidase family protein [bacterium]